MIVSSHSQCRRNAAIPLVHPKLHLAISKWKCSAWYYAALPTWDVCNNLENSMLLFYGALLWSPSLLRSGCSQWLMLSSESLKEPSTYFVLPKEARTQGWELTSEMWKLRRTSRTSEKVSKVPKQKIIKCREEKKTLYEPYLNTTKFQ